jgi:hypothetical protein
LADGLDLVWSRQFKLKIAKKSAERTINLYELGKQIEYSLPTIRIFPVLRRLAQLVRDAVRPI